MSDPTILYFCDLCGGSVSVGDEPTDFDPDAAVLACATCAPVARLPLTRSQMQQVAEWIWEQESPR